MTVAVVGATGVLGSAVCRALSARGTPVRGLVRSASRGAALAELGVEVCDGDVERPSTLDACFAGVDAVVSTASAFPLDPRPDAIERVDLDGQLAVVDAAERAAVRRLVYLSFPPIALDFPFQRAKRAVEARLRHASVEAVVLQPAKFMDVWFTPPLGFDVDGEVSLYGDGAAPHQWVAAADVAAVVAHVIDREDAAGATLAFGGPEALGLAEVVQVYERVMQRPLATVPVPVAELEAMRARAATPMEASIAAVLVDATFPQVIEPAPLIRELGLEWTSVERFALGSRA